MNLKEKRRFEIENQKEKRKEEVIVAAVEVFKEKGIDNAKMTDIAEKAQVGIASIYRYFKTKSEIVVEAATMFLEKEIAELYNPYKNEDFKKLSGIEKVKQILGLFIKLYQNNQNFVSFIYEFDNYVVREQISKDKLSNYEEIIIDLRMIIFDAIKQGKHDNTINKEIDENQFYISITHALMSLCQKLILRGSLLESDKEVDGEVQLKLIIDMAVKYISNN